MGTVLFKPLAVSLLAVFFLGSLHAYEINGDDRPQNDQQVYIVYMGHQHEPSELPGGFSTAESAHHRLLSQVLEDDSPASDRIVYSYKRSMNGFAAKLSEQEKEMLSSMEGVVSVFPSRVYRVQTTRSWDFIGLPETATRSLPTEGDVIVGMLDTGVWPDSPSFADDGLGPPPRRWKGACHNFTCNNKIIGARAYRQGHEAAGLSPVDTAGHGSHTASTVAGRVVDGVGLAGLAAGSARGAVPGARLAVYKVCWNDSCAGADMLAAFDDAIADGVDLISISIGGKLPAPYFEEAIAVGAFHAMRRGVLTSAAAGNSGLDGGRVCNVAPWILSVAASSTDRRLTDKIVLGNGKTIVGASVNTFPKVDKAPLVFPNNGSCDPKSLAGRSYKGKILLCAVPNDGEGPFLAGAAGAVSVSYEADIAFSLPLPGLTVTQDHFTEILAYVNKTRKPVGTIHATVSTFDSEAPIVASFSSPGPNIITPAILKPDVSAPGIDILAAWTPLSSVTGNLKDNRFTAYNIISGTSMACPHATGVAAYVKSFHPDWSPAMIMSALITTATPMDPSRNRGGGELTYGAGQLSAARAREPGLVYDAREEDYVRMLCAEGYNSTQLRAVTGADDDDAATACAAAARRSGTAGDLNYPTMAHLAAPKKRFAVRFPRTVTNVGARGSVYVAKVVGSGQFVNVTVAPRRLAFARLLQKRSFTVTVSGEVPGANEFVSAAVVWSDGVRQVRSPIIVHTVDVK
ncbi:hypothetical protein ACP4OV_011633 [Aristida adscensionis]